MGREQGWGPASNADFAAHPDPQCLPQGEGSRFPKAPDASVTTPHPACGRPLPEGARWGSRWQQGSGANSRSPPHRLPPPCGEGTRVGGRQRTLTLRLAPTLNASRKGEGSRFPKAPDASVTTPHPACGRPLPEGARWGLCRWRVTAANILHAQQRPLAPSGRGTG
ncbi:hypothetical protein XM25_16903 [Devosia sp. H5989]|nr:hypothetical protein XM25_16903 [Devosia sp. H5989]